MSHAIVGGITWRDVIVVMLVAVAWLLLVPSKK